MKAVSDEEFPIMHVCYNKTVVNQEGLESLLFLSNVLCVCLLHVHELLNTHHSLFKWHKSAMSSQDYQTQIATHQGRFILSL